VLSLGFWLLHVRVETRHVHAERLLAKVGGSNRKPRGIPTLATGAQRKWKGRSEAEVCTSEARKIGEWLAGARGYLPLAAFAVAFVSVGGALRGGYRPAEVGAEDAKQPQPEGDFLPQQVPQAARQYDKRLLLSSIHQEMSTGGGCDEEETVYLSAD
jgi:hypothetical protein